MIIRLAKRSKTRNVATSIDWFSATVVECIRSICSSLSPKCAPAITRPFGQMVGCRFTAQTSASRSVEDSLTSLNAQSRGQADGYLR